MEYNVNAELRSDRGRTAARRLRNHDKVPAVLYGAGKDSVSLTLEANEIKDLLSQEAFHSSILTIRAGAETAQAVLRDYALHPYKPKVMHVDFQRVRATEKMHMSVPLHFVGEDEAPGVRLEDGIVSHLFNEVDVTCLPKDLPSYLEVDVSALGINESLHLSDIKLPEGVELTALMHGEEEDHAIVSISHAKVVEEEEELEAEEEMEGEEGEEPEEGEGEEESSGERSGEED